MDRTQGSDSGIGFKGRIQESDSGIGFRDRIQESDSGVKKGRGFLKSNTKTAECRVTRRPRNSR